jgi:hypothetical protein
MFDSTVEPEMVLLAETLSTDNRVLSNVRLNVTPSASVRSPTPTGKTPVEPGGTIPTWGYPGATIVAAPAAVTSMQSAKHSISKYLFIEINLFYKTVFVFLPSCFYSQVSSGFIAHCFREHAPGHLTCYQEHTEAFMIVQDWWNSDPAQHF